jgi:transcriptional regulator with XRE-family HTH domain
MLMRVAIGRELRELRLNQKRSLREVSGTAQISVGYLSEIERGQKELSSELLRSVTRALGVEVSSVLAAAAASLNWQERLDRKSKDSGIAA